MNEKNVDLICVEDLHFFSPREASRVKETENGRERESIKRILL